MNASLELRGLRKFFGQRLIFEIAELILQRGSSYVLTGNNGCGKTTLLRVLAGLETADMASFEFDGSSLAGSDLSARLAPRVIYLHQHPYLFSTSVKANIAFGLKAAGKTHREQLRLVDEAMDWAGVRHLTQVPPHRLSGGEKQRVALARARVLNPSVLLLDEPTANLDEAARGQVAALIRQMCDDNHCVVIATHDPELMALENGVSWRLHDTVLSVS